MWFKRGVGGSVWYVASLDQYKTLSNLQMSITKQSMDILWFLTEHKLSSGLGRFHAKVCKAM